MRTQRIDSKSEVLATEPELKRGNLLILTFDGMLYEDDIPLHCLQMLKHGIKLEEVAKTGFRVTGSRKIVWNRDFTKKEVVSW